LVEGVAISLKLAGDIIPALASMIAVNFNLLAIVVLEPAN